MNRRPDQRRPLAQGRVVLTGASGGIGAAIAEVLASQGARLILVARNPERLTALKQALPGKGHLTVATDLATVAGRACLLDACRRTDSPVNILINNAGCSSFGMFEERSAEEITATLTTNLLSPMLVCRALLPLLKQAPAARILNIGSTFGSIGYPANSVYCASKFGLRGFSEALRRELADSSVQVTYIAPRATRTSINSDRVVALNEELGTQMDQPEVVARRVLNVLKNDQSRDQYIGWPEKLFVRINALAPGLVDNSLRRQLPVIRRFAKAET